MMRACWLVLVLLGGCTAVPRPCASPLCEPLPGQSIAVSDAELWTVEAGAGPPLLLLHGIPTSSYLWRNVQRRLAATHRTVAVDLPGLGRSRLPDGGDRSLTAQADRMAALLDVLGIARAVVVAHDIGGGVAQLLAARHPERVEALVLIDTVAFVEYWPIGSVQLLALPLLGELASLLPPLPSIARSQLRSGMEHAPEDAVLDHYVEPLCTVGGRFRFLRFVRALDPPAVERAIAENAARGLPVRVLWGSDDPFQPLEEGRRLAAKFGAPMRVLEGARHFLPEERPIEVGDCVREAMRELSWP